MESDSEDSRTLFQCHLCHWHFSTQSSLEMHLKNHSKEKPFPCINCDKKYATTTGLKMHMMVHTGERPHKCEMCAKAFTTRAVLKMHMRGHTGEKPYVCKVCGDAFTQSASLTEHVNTFHNSKKRYKCKVCCKEYLNKNKFRVHSLTHKNEKCQVCEKKFLTKEGLVNHEKIHILGEKPFKCDNCEESFHNKKKLIHHLGWKHSDILNFKCEICGKLFHTKTTLTSHYTTHKEKKQCKLCGHMILHMSSHMQKHKKRIPPRIRFTKLLCSVCGYRTNIRPTMLKHWKICPLSQQNNHFKCDFCDKECENYDTLKVHVVEHVIGPIPTVCITIFQNKGYLNNPALIVQIYNTIFEQNHGGQKDSSLQNSLIDVLENDLGAFKYVSRRIRSYNSEKPKSSSKKERISIIRNQEVALRRLESGETVTNTMDPILSTHQEYGDQSLLLPDGQSKIQTLTPVTLKSKLLTVSQTHSNFTDRIQYIQEMSMNIKVSDEVSAKEEHLIDETFMLSYKENFNENQLDVHSMTGTPLSFTDGIAYTKSEQTDLIRD